MLSRLTVVLFLSLTAVACVTQRETMQDWSSGELGCNPEDIAISKIKSPNWCGQTHTWVAQCDGVKYRCMNATSYDGCVPNIHCKEIRGKPVAAE